VSRPASTDRPDGFRRSAAVARAAGVTAVALLALVAALGDSAAVPGLGPATGAPPWDLAAHPSSWLVTVLVAAGYGLGAVSVSAGLRAVAAGYRPRPRAVALAGAAAVAVLVVVPPLGSADHLSYVAYGRIAAAGDDPYAVPPLDWRGGHDPVAGAVQPPWQRTPSVYGPVATAAQALVAELGGGSLRLTVWWWQVLGGVAFLLVGALLDRLAAGSPAASRARARVAVAWTLNPLLLGQLVLGAHVDVLAVALAVAGLAVVVAVARSWSAPPGLGLGRLELAGLLLGAAVGMKAPYGLFGLAALWTLRGLPARRRVVSALALAAGALVVLVPAYRWAGPHAVDQLRAASRFTSLATPWRAVTNLGDLLLGSGGTAPLVAPAALALSALLAVRLWRRLRPAASSAGAPPDADEPPDAGEPPDAEAPDAVLRDAVRAALALTAAWVLLAPYALPWYDAMVWAPLALAAPSAVGRLGGLDGLLLARLGVLALAYVPGRVVGLAPALETVTLGFRRYVAPVLVLAVIVAVVRRPGARPRPQAPDAAPAAPDGDGPAAGVSAA